MTRAECAGRKRFGLPPYRDKLARMNRNNLLFLLVGVLVAVVAVLGYSLYQEKREPKGIQLNIGEKGISIEKK